MNLRIGPWDAVLIIGVSIQATVLAYLRDPKQKALVLVLPVPFTLATLSLGRQVHATNVMGVILLLGYTFAVWRLHAKLRVPIVPAIAAAALGYCVVGWAIASLVPASEWAFWVAAASALALGVTLYATMSEREEPAHRSPLPVWIKLPIVCGVIAVLVLIKNVLLGFMTVFPMVGTVAAYEARHSLWTICRQIPILMMGMVPMMVTCHLTYDRVGLGGSLAIGWLVFLSLMLPLTRDVWWPSRAKAGSA